MGHRIGHLLNDNVVFNISLIGDDAVGSKSVQGQPFPGASLHVLFYGGLEN